MFEYDFMQRALLAGIFLSLTIPLIGVVMVSRKTSMLGEAMSHVSLAGVGLGLVFGFSPVLQGFLLSESENAFWAMAIWQQLS